MFLLAQALDNRSEDQCVRDDLVFDASAGEVASELATLSYTLVNGVPATVGETSFYSLQQHIVIKIGSKERDVQGRRAPLLALLGRVELEKPLLASLIAEQAALIGRHTTEAFHEDLKKWVTSGKARGSRRSRLPAFFAGLWARLRASWLRRRTRGSE